MKRKLIVLSTIVLTCFYLVGISKAQPKFSIKLTGGYGTTSTGDINKVLSSWDTWFIDMASEAGAGFTKEGTFEKINWGLNFGGEFTINLTDNIGIGLGTEYIQRQKDSASSIKETTLGEVWGMDVEPRVTAIPIKLSAYYFHPVNSRMNLFFNGGIGYYFSNITCNTKFRTFYFEGTYLQSNEVKDSGFGLHGGIGFEYSVAKNIAFIMEGAGRYAKLKDWNGEEIATYPDGETEKETGALWYLESEDIPGKYYSFFELQKDAPNSYARNVRKFEVECVSSKDFQDSRKDVLEG